MADPHANKISEQYELGESAAPSEPASAAGPPAVEVSPAPTGASAATSAPERPRNPDGTFKKPESELERETYQHTPRLLRQAADLGMNPDEIVGIPPEDLRDLVREARLERYLQDRASAVDQALQADRAVAPPAAAPPVEADDSLGIDENDYDPGLLGVLKAQQKQIRALQAQLGQVQSVQQQGSLQSTRARCDAAFSKHEAVLGKGRFEDLTPDSSHMARRRAVLSLVDGMKGPGTIEAKIDRAVSTLFGTADSARSAAPPVGAASGGADLAEQWSEAALARPTHRQGASEPPGRDKAEAAVRQFFQQNGGRSTPTIADEFPE